MNAEAVPAAIVCFGSADQPRCRKALSAFLAFFAARFSSKVLSGFFFVFFF
jgi:hypothetical protein